MSEYQYYEFLAIDRPLTSEELSYVRALSTRAQITPVSFTNEYHWGDFKGNPNDLMRRFYDAHVYVANWATAIFKVRVPIEVLTDETVEALEALDYLYFDSTPTHWVITWCLEECDNYDRFAMEDGRDWMAKLAPVRDELLRGDIRSLYIGWLVAVSAEMLKADELEPFPVKGMGRLTAAQQTLAAFLEVDPFLLESAMMDTSAQQDEGSSQQEINEWIDSLPQDEVTKLLHLLLAGQGQQAERTLKNRFAAWQRGLLGGRAESPRRTVEELRKNAEIIRKQYLEEEERKQKKQGIKRRKEREAYLKALSKDFPKAWMNVQQTVERKTGPAYDEACHALVDLSEAYSLQSEQETFEQELRKFMAGHTRRKALIQRLVKAGIWDEK